MIKKQILIFDSGVGGLSVYQEIMYKNPNINSFYLFDNACFPYGELEDNFLIKRVTELLVNFTKTHSVDLIVIACNSASTLALKALRRHFSIPVVGVVPAIKPASLLTENKIIGLLATPATIQREYTTELINKFAANIDVLKIGSTELVKLAEEKLHGIAVDKTRLQAVLQPWTSLVDKPDTLVLGCTHFPLLKSEIMACFKSPIKLVDSGEAIASRVKQLLGNQREKSSQRQHSAYYTRPYSKAEEDSFKAIGAAFYRYGFRTLECFQANC